MSALASSQPSSSAVEKVLIGTATAPIRADAQPRGDEVDAGGEEDADVRAASDSGADQSAGDVEGRVLGVGVREALVVADDERVVTPIAGVLREDCADRRHWRARHRARRGETAGRPSRLPLNARHLRRAEQLVVEEELGVGPDPIVFERSLGGDPQRGQQRSRTAIAHGEVGGLPGQAQVAVELLEHAVEVDREEAAVHDSRGPLVTDRERHRADGPVVGTLEVVQREARVVVADVARVVDVDALLGTGRVADPRREVCRAATPRAVHGRHGSAPSRCGPRPARAPAPASLFVSSRSSCARSATSASGASPKTHRLCSVATVPSFSSCFGSARQSRAGAPAPAARSSSVGSATCLRRSCTAATTGSRGRRTPPEDRRSRPSRSRGAR